MALSYVTYAGDGSTTNFSVTFPYIATTDVDVYVDGVLKTVTTDYTWFSATVIQFLAAPAVGAVIRFQRTTTNTSRLVDFQDAGNLTEADLDLSANQLFYLVQEDIDQFNDLCLVLDTDNQWNAESHPIKNLADPTNPQDAVTKYHLDSLITALSAAAMGLAYPLTANRFAKVDATGTLWELFDLLATYNTWTEAQMLRRYTTGNSLWQAQSPDVASDAGYHGLNVLASDGSQRCIVGSIPGLAGSYGVISVWDDTLGTPAWNAALSIARDAKPMVMTTGYIESSAAGMYLNPAAGSNPAFWFKEADANKAQYSYDATTHTLTVQKQLDATPGTAANKIELKDSGEILMTDAVGGVTLSLTGAVVEAGSTGATSLRVNAATNNSPTAYLKENGNSRCVWFYDYASHIAYLRKYLDATPATITNQVKLGDDGSLTLEDVTDSTSLVVNSDGTTIYGTGSNNCRLSVDAPTNQYATFNLRENGNNRGQMYYDHAAHDLYIRKFLDATPATVAGLIQMADSGTITIKDNINSAPLIISGAANGGTITFNGKGTRVRACVVNCANPTPAMVLNPASWTVARIGVGHYRITHDYNSYNIVINGNALGGGLDCVVSFQMITASTFDIFMYVAGALADNAYLNLNCVLF